MSPALIFAVSDFVASPLPSQVKHRWSNWPGFDEGNTDEARQARLQKIELKLRRAQVQREAFKNWVLMPKRDGRRARATVDERDLDVLSKRIQEKQDDAERKRVGRLSDRLAKLRQQAREAARRREDAERRVAQRIARFEEQLTQHMRSADERRAMRLERRVVAAQSLCAPRGATAAPASGVPADGALKGAEDAARRRAAAAAAREALLERVAARAGERVQRAKGVSQAQREAELEHAAALKQASQAKLDAAEARRTLFLSQLSAAHAGRAPDAFLRSRAARRERLKQSAHARALQLCWRAFRDGRKTTAALAQAFVETSLPGKFADFPSPPPSPPAEDAFFSDSADDSAHGDDEPPPRPITPPSAPVVLTGFGRGAGMLWQQDFDRFSACIQAPETLRTTKALLVRLEQRFHATRGDGAPAADCAPLLARLFPRAARARAHIDRYPVRIVLCAFMMHAHPHILFSGNEFDARVRDAAEALLRAFDALLLDLVTPLSARASCDGSAAAGGAGEGSSTRALFDAFDAAWVEFLEIFVAWKGADAAGIERDLIRVGVELQQSMLTACGGDAASERVRQSEQLQAIVEHVRYDQSLLRQRLRRLRGPEAVARFDARIAAVSAPTAPPTAPAEPEQAAAPRAAPPGPPGPPQRRVSFSRQLVTHRDGSKVPGGWQIPTAADNGAAAAQPVDGRLQPGHQEIMMHRLLVDPAWRPERGAVEARWAAVLEATGERMPADPLNLADGREVLVQKVRFIAEDALVDAALHGLVVATGEAYADEIGAAQVCGTLQQVLALLAELAGEVMTVLPSESAERERLGVVFDGERLAAMLADEGGLAGQVAVVARVLEESAQMLTSLGAAARAAPAEAALERMRGMLRDVLTTPRPRAELYRALADCLGRALRMLLVQLHMLRLDAAHARLALLAQTLSTPQAAAYVCDKFCARLAVAPSMPVAALRGGLPITHDLALSSPRPAHLDDLLQRLAGAAVAPPITALRTGRVAAAPAAPGPRSGSLAADPPALAPVGVQQWQARFRCAVAALLLQPVPLAGNPTLPEVLALDDDDLEAARASFHALVAAAVALQGAAALRGAAGGPPPSDAALAKRLVAAAAANPAGFLEAAVKAVADACEVPEAAAAGVLRSALAPGSPALRTTASKLLHVTQAVLLHERAGYLNEAARAPSSPLPWALAVLPRLGLLTLHAELAGIVYMLARVAAVAEAVHDQQLSTLFGP